MAHAYSHLFNIPCTGLRFFTVYGPWGRPDMAYYTFTQKIDRGLPIDVFNHGQMMRDFTYIDDIVNSLIALIERAPKPQESKQSNAHAPYTIFNIGNNNSVSLERFMQAIEKALNKKAIINYLPMQAGDVPVTYADIDSLIEVTGLKPTTEIENGILKFVDWYTTHKFA